MHSALRSAGELLAFVEELRREYISRTNEILPTLAVLGHNEINDLWNEIRLLGGPVPEEPLIDIKSGLSTPEHMARCLAEDNSFNRECIENAEVRIDSRF